MVSRRERGTEGHGTLAPIHRRTAHSDSGLSQNITAFLMDQNRQFEDAVMGLNTEETVWILPGTLTRLSQSLRATVFYLFRCCNCRHVLRVWMSQSGGTAPEGATETSHHDTRTLCNAQTVAIYGYCETAVFSSLLRDVRVGNMVVFCGSPCDTPY